MIDKEYIEFLGGSFIGADEAGYGCYAGSGVGAACYLPNDKDLYEYFAYELKVKESKSIKEEQRYLWETEIKKHLKHHVTIISAKKLDVLGYKWFKNHLLENPVEELKKLVTDENYKIIYDGNPSTLKTIHKNELFVQKGDIHYLSVACASILAKSQKDREMHEFHKKYPEYHFDKHKGYGTKVHQEMINKHGLCPIHRTIIKKLKGLPINQKYKS